MFKFHSAARALAIRRIGGADGCFAGSGADFGRGCYTGGQLVHAGEKLSGYEFQEKHEIGSQCEEAQDQGWEGGASGEDGTHPSGVCGVH